MNVTLAGIDELEMFPSAEAREQAIAEHADSVRGWDLVLGIAICIVVALASWALARWGVLGGLSLILGNPPPGIVRELVSFAVVATCMFLTIRGLHRWGVRREFRAKLLVHGVPICLNCGYLLRGLPGDASACPECGRAIDQRAHEILNVGDSVTSDHPQPS